MSYSPWSHKELDQIEGLTLPVSGMLELWGHCRVCDRQAFEMSLGWHLGFSWWLSQ